MKQYKLFKFNTSKSHGGAVTSGKRKTARPLNKKRLHHIVMKSNLAKGRYSFKSLRHRQKIETLIHRKAQIYGIRIAEYSNVGNHLHLVVRFQCPYLFKNFLKVTMGLIARIVTHAKKGKQFGRFWDGLVFSRIISPGRDQARIFEYIAANVIESEIGNFFRRQYELECERKWKKRRQAATDDSKSFRPID